MDKKWYFKFDPTTFEFVPGAILADEQPENATTIEPTGFYGLPKWNPTTNSWTGQPIDDYLAEQKANYQKQVDPNQQALASLAMQVMKTNAELTARVKALEAKEANNV